MGVTTMKHDDNYFKSFSTGLVPSSVFQPSSRKLFYSLHFTYNVTFIISAALYLSVIAFMSLRLLNNTTRYSYYFIKNINIRSSGLGSLSIHQK